MKSTDIYLCKVQVNEHFKIIRKPHFRGFSEPFKVIEPNPTITQVKELAASRARLKEMQKQIIQMYIDSNKKGA